MSLRQVYFASLDLALHSEYKPGTGDSVFSSGIVKRVIDENTVLPPLPEDRFLNSFQHIFAGGYSAGLLSSQAFSLNLVQTEIFVLRYLVGCNGLFSAVKIGDTSGQICC